MDGSTKKAVYHFASDRKYRALIDDILELEGRPRDYAAASWYEQSTAPWRALYCCFVCLGCVVLTWALAR